MTAAVGVLAFTGAAPVNQAWRETSFRVATFMMGVPWLINPVVCLNLEVAS